MAAAPTIGTHTSRDCNTCSIIDVTNPAPIHPNHGSEYHLATAQDKFSNDRCMYVPVGGSGTTDK